MNKILLAACILTSCILGACAEDSDEVPMTGSVHTYLKDQVERFGAAANRIEKAVDEMQQELGDAPTDPDIKLDLMARRAKLLDRMQSFHHRVERAKEYLAKGCTTEMEARAMEKIEARVMELQGSIESRRQESAREKERSAQVLEQSLRMQEQLRAAAEEVERLEVDDGD